jgi:hypothetical protein
MISQAIKLTGAAVLGVASVGVSISAPTLTNLDANDLSAFANGQRVEVTAYRPGRSLAAGLGAAGLGLLSWWLWRELTGDPATKGTSTAPPAPMPEDAAAAITQRFDAVRQRIFDSLNVPDYAWILQLMECETLLVVGGQGFGKTRFVASLCYLRHLLMGHQLILVSPHGHQDDFWLTLPIGSHGEYEAIGTAIAAYQNRLKEKDQQSKHLTQLWDEFTQYGGQVNNAERLFTSVATEPRKANEHHILVAHSEAKGIANGGGKATGFQDLKDACIVLTIHGKRGITGRAEPAFKGHLKGFSYDDKGAPETVPVVYPKWMHYPEKLLAVIPTYDSSTPSSAGLPTEEDWKSQEEVRKTLEDTLEDTGRQSLRGLRGDLEDLMEDLPKLEDIAPKPPYPPTRNLFFIEFAFLFVECDSLRKIFNDVWGEGYGDGSRSIKLKEWCKLAFCEWLPAKHLLQIKQKHPNLFT